MRELAYDCIMNGLTPEEVTAQQASIETRMDARLSALEQKMDAGFAAARAESDRRFAEVRADMEKLKSEFVKWVVGIAIAMSATGITVMTFVLNYAVSKPSVQPPAPAPIVIYLPAQAPAPLAPGTRAP